MIENNFRLDDCVKSINFFIMPVSLRCFCGKNAEKTDGCRQEVSFCAFRFHFPGGPDQGIYF
ncbi:hypothetical protein DN748_18085 [Sinomicrobium soli]|nr:hypothetical protein DN748_18085 [Sinomicrobium sp. N-1-3-6]